MPVRDEDAKAMTTARTKALPASAWGQRSFLRSQLNSRYPPLTTSTNVPAASIATPAGFLNVALVPMPSA